MAIKKEVVTTSGVTASYWRLGSLFIDPANNVTWATLELYLSEEAAKLKHCSPLMSKRVELRPNPCTKTAMDGLNAYALVYAQIKKAPDFSGAEDS